MAIRGIAKSATSWKADPKHVALTFRGSLRSQKRNGALPRGSSREKLLSLSLSSPSSLSFPFLLSLFRKARHVSAFFTGALLRFTDGLHPLQAWHSNLRHKDKSRSEFLSFSPLRVATPPRASLQFHTRSATLCVSTIFFLFSSSLPRLPFLIAFLGPASASLCLALSLKREIVCANSSRMLADRFVRPLQLFPRIKDHRRANEGLSNWVVANAKVSRHFPRKMTRWIFGQHAVLCVLIPDSG